MTRIDHYELLDEIARGGMGVVYRARDTRLDRLVAFKVLLAFPGEVLDLAERFQREAEAAARIRHPHVVSVHAAGFAHGRPYLVMDLVEGESLAARLKRAGPFAPSEALSLVLRLAEALGAAHRLGILHRDLKPENVLLDAAGQPRLTDFGLAKLLDRQTRLTVTGELMGTPSYMAPEQIEDARQVGPPADLYGLGGILYALLTGRPPHTGATVIELLDRVLHQDPRPPSAWRPGLDPRLEALCLRCLARDPAERFPSAEALAEALRALEAPAATVAGRRLLGMGLALAGAALGLAVWAVAGRETSPPQVAGGEDSTASRAARGPEEVQPDRSLRVAAEVHWLRERASAALAEGDAEAALAQLHEARELAPQDREVLLDLAELRSDRGEHAAALELHDELIAQAPADARRWTLRARACLRACDDPSLREAAVEEARGNLEQALEIDPREALAHAFLARLELLAGRPSLALEAADRALVIDSRQHEAYLARAVALGQLERFAPARDAARRAVELGSEPGYLVLAQAQNALGEARDAIATCGRALELGLPIAYEFQRERGVARARLGQEEGALRDFSQVLAQVPGDPTALVGRAELYLAQQRFELARDDLRRLLAERPEHPAASRLLARTWLEDQRPLEAAEQLAAHLQRWPDDVRAQALRGRLLLAQGQLRSALSLLDRVLLAGLREAWVLRARAEARRELGRSSEALEDVEAALGRDGLAEREREHLERLAAELRAELTPPPPEALERYGVLMKRALVAVRAGREDEAQAVCLEASELLPGLPTAWMQLAGYHRSRGRLAQALLACDRAIAAKRSSPVVWAARGAILAEQGEPAQALMAYRRAAQLAPAEGRYPFRIADLLLSQRKLAEAVAAATQAIELDRRHAKAYALRAHARRLLGDQRGALADAEQLIALQPQDPLAQRQTAQLLMELRAFPRVLAWTDGVLQRRPDDAYLLLARANAKMALGRFPEAATDAARAQELDPELPQLARLLGELALQRRDAATALSHFERAIERGNAADPWLHLLRGEALRQLDRPRQALDCFQHAVRLAPQRPEVHHDLGRGHEALGELAAALAAYRAAAARAPANTPIGGVVRAAIARVEEAQRKASSGD